MRRIAWLAGLMPLAVTWACSSTADHPATLGGSAGTDSGVIVISGDSGVPSTCLGAGDGGCNALQLCGPQVNVIVYTSKPPMPAGGTISDGTYVLTASTFYKNGTEQPSGTLRQVLRFSSGSGSGGDGGTEGSTDGAAEARSDDASGEAADDAAAEAGTDDASADAGAGDGSAEASAGLLTFMVDEISQENSGLPSTFTWSVEAVAPSLGWAAVCPSSAPAAQFSYTASASSLMLFEETAGVGTAVATYTKQ